MTVATTEQTNAGVNAIDQHDEQILRYLGLNPDNPADRAAVAVCRAYNFDPILKHVVVIPKGGVYITRDGLLHVAHRSGQLDGIVVDQEPILRDGQWVARVSVYRKDMRHPFTFPGRYSAQGSNRAYAPEMALKAAESHALRRAFDVTGLPTIDEDREPVEHEASTGGGLAAALADDEDSPAPGRAGVEATGGEIPSSPPESPDEPAETGEVMKDKTRAAMFAEFGKQGIEDADKQRAGISSVIGREIESRGELTEAEAKAVIKALKGRSA